MKQSHIREKLINYLNSHKGYDTLDSNIQKLKDAFRNGVIITYQSWNDYLCQPDGNPIITYDTEKTVTNINQVIPTIEALYEKINCLRFDL